MRGGVGLSFAAHGVSCREKSPLNLQQRWAVGSWSGVATPRGSMGTPGHRSGTPDPPRVRHLRGRDSASTCRG